MINLEELRYQFLLLEVLLFGDRKSFYTDETDENGTPLYTRSRYGRNLSFDLSKGKIPIYTTKNTYWQGAIKEMLWFIKGEGDITDLAKNKVFIWNKWAYKYFLGLAEKDIPASLVPYWKKEIVEKSIRNNAANEFVDYLVKENISFRIPIPYTDFTNWKVSKSFSHSYINQMDWAISEIKANPLRRHYKISAWNPSRLYQMAKSIGNESVVLAACHADHVLFVDSNNRINLHLNLRSNDLFLGNPFNVCQYAILLNMYSLLTGYRANRLYLSITDAHIYSNQIKQCWKQIFRIPYEFPTLKIEDRGQKSIKDFCFSDFSISRYKHHSKLTAEVVLAGG